MDINELDLDAIEARAEDFPRYGLTGSDRQLIDEDVPALVAEVRRLREVVAAVETLVGEWDDMPPGLADHMVHADYRRELRDILEQPL